MELRALANLGVYRKFGLVRLTKLPRDVQAKARAFLAGGVEGLEDLAQPLLVDAGAIVFGKTNVPLFGSDLQSFNDVYGTTNNPWDVSRVPGGSSGGSAAALAAGLTMPDDKAVIQFLTRPGDVTFAHAKQAGLKLTQCSTCHVKM